MIIVQFSRVEICGVDTSKIKFLKEAEKKELLRLANEKIVKIINEEVLPLFENVNNFYKKIIMVIILFT